MMRVVMVAAMVLGLAACGDSDAADPDVDSAADADADTDAVADTDAAADVVADTEATADAGADADADVSPWLEARDYCESSEAMFCAYYTRCGRMAVPDEATCRTVFREVCNAVYEPVYAAAADAGLLSLSRAGLDTCAAHLETVACERQINDLDGGPDGCGAVWVGTVAEGGACGPGIESFVCDPQSTCVLDLSFCGTCQAMARDGEACAPPEGARCHPESSCVEGTCAPRPRPGDGCADDGPPCVTGASCVAGVCDGWDVVAVGDACDQARRCPYKAACVGGTCVESALQGEACGGGVQCASGVCQGGACVAPTGTPAFNCVAD